MQFRLLCLFAAAGLTSLVAAAQVPTLVERNGHHAFMVGGQPYLILGGQIHSHPGPSESWQIMVAEEGSYQDGKWKVRRLLNGDECDFGVELAKAGRIIHMKLGTF